jgi:hypothetical protein
MNEEKDLVLNRLCNVVPGSDVYIGKGDRLMKVWKIAALVALAAIPVLLISTNNQKKKDGFRPAVGESDNIFESELTVE